MANRFWVGGTAAWDATALLKWSTTTGGVGGAAVPTAADDVFFDANSGAGTVTASGSGVCRNLDFTGFVGTFAGSGGLTVSGTFTWAAGMTRTHTGGVTFNATAGVQGITSNGIAFGGTITLNGVGGTWQLQDAAIVVSTVTLTNGALDTNSKNFTCGSFTASGAAARVLTIANSTVTLTAGNWNLSSSTNLTVSAAGSSLTFATSTAAALAFQSGGFTYGDVTFAGSGTGTLTVSGLPVVRDFRVSNSGGASYVCSTTLTIQRDYIFSGYTGTWSGSGTTLIGRHFTAAAGMTATSITGLTFNATSGSSLITTNGVALNNAITFDGVGGTWVLQDALSTSRGLTLTNGTLDTNGKAVACTRVASVNSNTRALNLTNMTLTLNGLNLVVFDLTGAGMTFSSAGSLIRVNNTGSVLTNVQNFNQGSLAFNNVEFFGTGPGNFSFTSATGASFTSFANNSTAPTLTVLGNNTFGSFALTNPPDTLTLGAGSTQTIGVLTMSGAAGSPLAIRSTVPGTQARLSVPKNNVAGDYIDAQDCVATGGARWFAGKHGVNSGGNNGWRFTDAAPRPPAVKFAA